MNKKLLVLIGFLMVSFGVQADLSDDFDRVDGPVGGGWVSAGVASWAIQSNQLVEAGGNPAASYLVNTNAQAATTTSALSFSVSVEANVGEVDDMTGIVWNWQDASNYQFVRMRWGNGSAQLQVGQVTNGVQNLVYSKENNALNSLFTDTAYILSLAYDKESATYTIKMPPTTNPTGERNLSTFSDSEFSGVATGGKSGIYSLFKTDAGNIFDNFQVVVVPDPSTPITPATIVGWSAVSNNVMKMVVDAPDAAENYYPQTAMDLEGGTWTNVAHSIDGFTPFVFTNLAYSTAEGTNEVIYVQANDAQAFFGIGE